MNRNFRTLVKARQFHNRPYADLESRINDLESVNLVEAIDFCLQNMEICTYDDLEERIDRELSRRDFVVYDDIEDFQTYEGVERMISKAMNGYEDLSDWEDSRQYMADYDIEDLIDDRLGDYESVIRDRVSDEIADYDFTEDVDSVINTYDFDLVMENTALVAQVKELTLKVRMLEVLAGLNVKE